MTSWNISCKWDSIDVWTLNGKSEWLDRPGADLALYGEAVITRWNTESMLTLLWNEQLVAKALHDTRIEIIEQSGCNRMFMNEFMINFMTFMEMNNEHVPGAILLRRFLVFLEFRRMILAGAQSRLTPWLLPLLWPTSWLKWALTWRSRATWNW